MQNSFKRNYIYIYACIQALNYQWFNRTNEFPIGFIDSRLFKSNFSLRSRINNNNINNKIKLRKKLGSDEMNRDERMISRDRKRKG